MDKNSKNCKSMSLCERLFRAIKVSPSFRKFGHRSSLQSPSFSPQTLQVAPKPSNPVELVLEGSPDNSPMKQHKTNNSGYMTKPKQHKDNVAARHSDRDNHDDINERFNDFINQARLRIIRTASNAETGKGGPARADSVNDKASEFIDRARMRIRTTSSNLGNGKF